MNTKVISMAAFKGGCAKTTSTSAIGAALASKLPSSKNNRILLIDMDPQANLTLGLGKDSEENASIVSLLNDGTFEPISIDENLELIRGDRYLSAFAKEMNNDEFRKNFYLKEALEPIIKSEKYSHILIDLPPQESVIVINALTASNFVLSPCDSEYYAVSGLCNIEKMIDSVQKYLNKNLEFLGVFITRFDSRKALHKQIKEMIQESYQDKLFQTEIKTNVALAEAAACGETIFSYDDKSVGAKCYKKLANELVGRI